MCPTYVDEVMYFLQGHTIRQPGISRLYFKIYFNNPENKLNVNFTMRLPFFKRNSKFSRTSSLVQTSGIHTTPLKKITLKHVNIFISKLLYFRFVITDTAISIKVVLPKA